MTKPIIVISAGRHNHYTPHKELQTVTIGCDIEYLDAVIRAGGTPLILPCVADREAIHAALQVADGLLLSGGGDILSLAYGEEPHPKSAQHDPSRDAFEFELTRQALAMNLPILGICRGLQLLNVVCGGTLIQDLPSQLPAMVKHQAEGLTPVLLHSILIEPDTLLADILRTSTMAVNSWHHQAINELGAGLRVNCSARDGVIEGVESADGKPVLAVQYHPEECAALYPGFQELFDWLIHQARTHREIASTAMT